MKLDKEFFGDCKVWLEFLENSNSAALCRPFIDLNISESSKELKFYTDSSRSEKKGLGCIFNKKWTFAKWEPGYIEKFQPSIKYLELLALCIGIFTWEEELSNMRIIIFCDNKGVMENVNDMSCKCKNSMFLIRKLVLNNLKFNHRIWVEYIKSKDNVQADALSRMEFNRFWKNSPVDMDRNPSKLPDVLWPASKLWQDDDVKYEKIIS